MVDVEQFLIGFVFGFAVDRLLVSLPWIIRHYDTIKEWSEDLAVRMAREAKRGKKGRSDKEE